MTAAINNKNNKNSNDENKISSGSTKNNNHENNSSSGRNNNRGGSGLRLASISAGNKLSESDGIWGNEGGQEAWTRGRAERGRMSSRREEGGEAIATKRRGGRGMSSRGDEGGNARVPGSVGGGHMPSREREAGGRGGRSGRVKSRSSCSCSGGEELAELTGETSRAVVLGDSVGGEGDSPSHFKYRKPNFFALRDTFCAFSGGGGEAISLHDVNEKIFRSYEPVIRHGG